jgi:glycosyltransferase involved in cell wall biosynthesis
LPELPLRDLPLSLVVFAYGEAENVPVVLGGILTWLRSSPAPFELLFVDDGSRDGTGAAAARLLADEPRAKVLTHDRNRGIGAALKTGVRAATLPWVTFLPCDGQIAPSSLDVLLTAAADAVRAGGACDVVFSVYRNRDDGWHRTLMSWGIRALIRGMLGVDLTSDGPYLFRRELFVPERLPPDSFFLNFEFPLRMLRAGRTAQVVTIACEPRRAGRSKSSGLRRIAGVARDLLYLRLRLWREQAGTSMRPRDGH